jgi:uncharacterized protein (DUF302 family)/uncharacterized membrane protein YidH (DUF202 family)
MDKAQNPAPKAALSDYLAAERTLLAWIRTGLAMMGFGFVVARFGLFLQQIRTVESGRLSQSFGFSLWFGTALIAVGVLVNILAGWHHFRLVRHLDRGETTYAHPTAQAVGVAFLLALVGIAMAAYLISIRSSTRALPESHKEVSMATNGIASKQSNHTVDQTVANLQSILAAKGVTRFALVDHSGEAEKAGMNLRPTKLLIFGSPKAGTPLMQAAPTAAIDLPLKLLVWEDADGAVWISWNTPEYLGERHQIPAELLKTIAVAATLAELASV